MELREYKSPVDMSKGFYDIYEPTGSIFTDYESIDLIVLPGMSFDKNCNRLGRGKGYYDRLLSKVPCAYKIGICFDFQKLDFIPTNQYDKPVDEVL